MYDSEVYSLSSDFISAYPRNQYPELLMKQARPLQCLLLDVSPDYFICIPFRSRISHSNAYMFKNSKRSMVTKSGLDYSKVILIKDSKYLTSQNVVVDQDEYNEAQINMPRIVSEITSYIDTYINHINGTSVLHHKQFDRLYEFSTLKYFHNILGI